MDSVTIHKTDSVVGVQESRLWLHLKSNFLIIRAIPEWNGLLFKRVSPSHCKSVKRMLTFLLSFNFSNIPSPYSLAFLFLAPILCSYRTCIIPLSPSTFLLIFPRSAPKPFSLGSPRSHSSTHLVSPMLALPSRVVGGPRLRMSRKSGPSCCAHWQQR